MRIAVVGAGSFGTAMSLLGERCGNEIMLWAHDARVAEGIQASRTNPVYLSGVTLPDEIWVTNDIEEAATFSDTIFMVVPSHYYRDVLTRIRRFLTRPVTIISGTKGIEIDTLQRMSEISRDVLGDLLKAFAVLSGPTFAAEVARGDPSAAVIASTDVDCAQEIQQALSSPTFRLYRSEDVVGVELAGSLKNVIAIAAGVLEGMGLGSNTTAALITRGLHEITRLSIALGGRMETMAGLAGMGDLVLTCTGSLSRNRTVGVALGKGKTLSQILSEMRAVAEGVKTSRAANELAQRHGIEMPIAMEMYQVLYEDASPRGGLQRLMTRSLKAETAR